MKEKFIDMKKTKQMRLTHTCIPFENSMRLNEHFPDKTFD